MQIVSKFMILSVWYGELISVATCTCSPWQQHIKVTARCSFRAVRAQTTLAPILPEWFLFSCEGAVDLPVLHRLRLVIHSSICMNCQSENFFGIIFFGGTLPRIWPPSDTGREKNGRHSENKHLSEALGIESVCTLFKQLDKVGKTWRVRHCKKKSKTKERWHTDGNVSGVCGIFKLCCRSEEDRIHAGGMVSAGLTHMFNTQNGHLEGAGNTDSTRRLKSPLLQQRIRRHPQQLQCLLGLFQHWRARSACFAATSDCKHLYSRHGCVIICSQWHLIKLLTPFL